MADATHNSQVDSYLKKRYEIHGGVRSLVLRFAKLVSALHAVEVYQANPIRKMVKLLTGMAKQVAK